MKDAREFFTKIADLALSLLFVPQCIVCKKTLPIGQSVFCPECRDAYENAKLRQCGGCGKVLPFCTCVNPAFHAGRVKVHRKLFKYDPKTPDSPENQLIYHLKHQNLAALRKFLACELEDAFKETMEDSPGEWVITYPPRSFVSIRKDGFDHMAELTKVCEKRLGIPAVSALRRTSRKSVPQKSLNERERKKNASESYALCADGDVTGKKVFLIDDVVTSASTMKACTDLLYGGGAKRVAWISIATVRRYIPRRKNAKYRVRRAQ